MCETDRQGNREGDEGSLCDIPSTIELKPTPLLTPVRVTYYFLTHVIGQLVFHMYLMVMDHFFPLANMDYGNVVAVNQRCYM